MSWRGKGRHLKELKKEACQMSLELREPILASEKCREQDGAVSGFLREPELCP